MKIKNIKINSFGNLENKDFELSDNINIIYGKNEAGKSTFLKFIINSFYGTSKLKKGREYSDYEKFKPWGKEEFSGKLKYILDNGEEFEVYREFGKKNPKIYNSNLEDISKNYTIDKNLGNQFFVEQTNIDETTFLSTIAAMQQEVKLEKNSQNLLIQKMANIASTGEDNVSYKKAIDKLYKKQLDEIGTYRSQGKPINITQAKLNDLKNKKHELENYKDIKYELEENKTDIEDEISINELKAEILKKIKKINENERIESEKINYNVALIQKDEREIVELINEKNRILIENNIENEEDLIINLNENLEETEIEKNEDIKVKVSFIKYLIISILVLIINLLLFYFLEKTYLKYIGLIGIPLILISYLIEKNKLKNKEIIKKNKKELSKKVEENKLLILNEKNKKILEEVNAVNAKIEIIEKNKREQLSKIDEIKNKITTLKNIEFEKIKNEYRKRIDVYEINKLINVESAYDKLEEIQNEINEKKLNLHRIEISKDNIMPQLESLARIEEEIKIVEEEYEDLMQKNNAILVVKQALEDAYNKMKNTVTPKFTNNLSENIAKISNDKYKKVVINDENGLMVELNSGDYVPADRLSLGTIDQLYLSLRLSMNTEVSNENMPLILDEAFAFYDDERLENIIKYFIDKYQNKQIIIFTCTNREENVLKSLGYNYNKISL